MDTHPLQVRTRPADRRLLLPALALVALAAAGCSSGGDSASTASSGGAVGAAGDVGFAPGARSADSVLAHESTQAQQRAVISTGQVELSSTDVAVARQRVGAVLVREGGHVADERTVTDRSGTVTSSHLVVRVPSARFDEAMQALEDVATLRSSSRKAEDVTTRVLDNGARIAAERAGVARLRQLVTSAGSLHALLAVERELTERQGELQSLRRQQAYLADQTSLATITVDISERVTTVAPEAAPGGFLGGLHHGWHALVATGTGLLVVVGALLPWAVAALLVGIPAWFLVRRLRRPREEDEAPAEA